MIENMMNLNKVGGIERGLGSFLTPVDPDPEFVKELGFRLRAPKSVTIEAEPAASPLTLLFVLTGLIAGVLAIFLLRRFH